MILQSITVSPPAPNTENTCNERIYVTKETKLVQRSNPTYEN